MEKTIDGVTCELVLMPKNAKCCEGCEVSQCATWGECFTSKNLNKVWKIKQPENICLPKFATT